MSQAIQLESPVWRVTFDPEQGVQWLAAEVRRDEAWISVVPDCRASPGNAPRAGQNEESALAAACFHMLPYSNRIRDARFRYDGTDYRLERPERHAIHGMLRKRPWRVLECGPRALRAGYDTARDGDTSWPWPIEATVDYRLDGAELHSSLQLTNRGETPMPAGFGWHPYFVRHLLTDDPEVTLPVSALYPDANGDCLPDGAAEPIPTMLDFREARRLDPAQAIDRCFRTDGGAARIRWADAGIALTLTGSEPLDHLVFYNPAQPHFAIEPVTHANDAVNLEGAGIEAGVRRLSPGETLAADLRLTVEVGA